MNKTNNIVANSAIQTVAVAECKIVIKVHGSTHLNQHLAITGNIQVLGNWQVDKALAMHTTKDIYPIWTAEFSLSTREAEKVEYKFVKIGENENKEVEWE